MATSATESASPVDVTVAGEGSRTRAAPRMHRARRLEVQHDGIPVTTPGQRRQLTRYPTGRVCTSSAPSGASVPGT
jgi:hypothetical protein